MPEPVSESRQAARYAVELAQTCSGYRMWKRVAMEKLQRHYTLTLAEANTIFDLYVVDTSKPIRKREETRPEFDDRFIYDFYTSSRQGQIYFEFTLNEDDPTDPTILIVSVHPPSFQSKL